MPDMLVKLFELPDSSALLAELAARGIVVRRAVSTEQRFVLAWVEQAFGSDWATNPVTQIKWGLQYIGDRYGSPCGAWAQSQATNWYILRSSRCCKKTLST